MEPPKYIQLVVKLLQNYLMNLIFYLIDTLNVVSAAQDIILTLPKYI